MKKVSARHLSNKERQLIVKRIKGGERLSKIGREFNISRTTLYKWLKMKSFGEKSLPKKGRGREVSAIRRRKIVKLALKYPDYSIRKISSMSGLSIGFVWSVMRKYSLTTKPQRQAYFLAHGTYLYKNIRAADKVIMIDRYMAGDSVKRICSDYGVSRTIFYRWIYKYISGRKKYKVFNESRPRGGSHWRFIAGMDKAVRDLVAKNPELSLTKLHDQIMLKQMDIISRSGLYYVCRRLELNTYEKRLIYAQSGGSIGVMKRGLLSITDPVSRRYLVNDISLFIQLALLSFSSLIISLLIVILGQRIAEYEAVSRVGITKIDTGGFVYEEKPESEEIIYIVKAGDSLWHISEEIYESGYNWVDIASANRLPDPDFIDIDQKLIIPVVEAKETTLVLNDQ